MIWRVLRLKFFDGAPKKRIEPRFVMVTLVSLEFFRPVLLSWYTGIVQPEFFVRANQFDCVGA